MQPKIAILGWGSLLWEGGADFDRHHEDWQFDGPTLRLEFSRMSPSRLGALTLVIDPLHGSPATNRGNLHGCNPPLPDHHHILVRAGADHPIRSRIRARRARIGKRHIV